MAWRFSLRLPLRSPALGDGAGRVEGAECRCARSGLLAGAVCPECGADEAVAAVAAKA